MISLKKTSLGYFSDRSESWPDLPDAHSCQQKGRRVGWKETVSESGDERSMVTHCSGCWSSLLSSCKAHPRETLSSAVRRWK